MQFYNDKVYINLERKSQQLNLIYAKALISDATLTPYLV